MQPSSLIFLVIIAIWAAYLLQHWVRRREHLATARSVDRFSDAMRVLERRTLLAKSDLSEPQPRSYAVSPVRSSRPEIVVDRAQSQSQSPSQSPSQSQALGASTPPAAEGRSSAPRPTRTSHPRAGISARRVRGLSFLVALLLVIVVPVLAAWSVLVWWSVPVVAGVFLADFVWLRRAAALARAARRRSATLSRPRSRSVSRTVARPAVASTVPPDAQPGSQPGSAVAVAPAGATAGAAGAPESADTRAEVDPSGWAPVPVPPPTYTLKAKADRPEPAQTVTEPAPAQPSSFDGLVDEGELDGLLNRRRAAGA